MVLGISSADLQIRTNLLWPNKQHHVGGSTSQQISFVEWVHSRVLGETRKQTLYGIANSNTTKSCSNWLFE